MVRSTPHELLTLLRAMVTTDATGATFDRVLQDCADRLYAAGALTVLPICAGPHSHAEYNSLIDTAEALAARIEQLESGLPSVEVLATWLYEHWHSVGARMGASEAEMELASRGDAEWLFAKLASVTLDAPAVK